MSKNQSIVLVNFGGPRNLAEIPQFLKELLCDKEVIRSSLPQPLHNLFFGRIAKKRAQKIAPDYELIGGKSPIHDDTEAIRAALSERLQTNVFAFHRYLPSTHNSFFSSLPEGPLTIFPMFPQFSYATTGSVARFFKGKISPSQLNEWRWISSYSSHPAFITLFQNQIRDFLEQKKLDPASSLFIYSAHGLPEKFITTGDIYQTECERSFRLISAAFPKAESYLTYQSKFGRGEWLKPYTSDFVANLQTDKPVVFIPLSFTSDHIETLFEVESEYMAPLRERGLEVHRCPAFNRSAAWVEAIARILEEGPFLANQMLVRKP